MIPRTQPVWQTSDWKQCLAESFTDPASFLRHLDLPPSLLPQARAAAARFPLRVPRGYADLIRKGDLDDPLLRQVLPLGEELQERVGFVEDPVGDRAAQSGTGILEKYRGRSLLLTTGACAIHCRYCFRRHFPYAGNSGWGDGWREALNRLRETEATEVILSGGDPLSLSNGRLRGLLDGLSQLPRLRRIRFHSRIPIVLPERLDDGLIGLLRGQEKRLLMVVHCNHAQELGEAARLALGRLRESGCLLFNQSVLLRGVNADAGVLAELSETLFDLGVLPYYLHRLDPVRGAAHYDLPDAEARRLYRQLLERVPGYMAPRLVTEIPGAGSKIPLGDILDLGGQGHLTSQDG
ncbi:MAG: EF-P beta-lysylation protein EpmB [Gammaproteobacteria bacterium]|nr:EF-P beta-lysylation protein EpmB [Gammaproteobacteria bacterium]MBU1655424.1 EF-P beta-lysylation protein EpmB [Gammaproteobacteria bacterium]MBU1961057.1 EF-P beta-lysylation protein EpmB [Gammaproteobacteria bacterium]